MLAIGANNQITLQTISAVAVTSAITTIALNLLQSLPQASAEVDKDAYMICVNRCINLFPSLDMASDVCIYQCLHKHLNPWED